MKLLLISILLCGFCQAGTTVSGTLSCSDVTSVTLTNGLTKEIDVVILAGQSNASGYPTNSTFADLPAYLQSAQTKVRTWFSTASAIWNDVSLQPYQTNLWGAELSMMQNIVSNYGRAVVLIKVSYGSTSLADRGGAYDWPKGQRQYAQLTGTVMRAKASLLGEGYKINWRAFAWVQGENDTASNAYAVAYATNFNTMWTNLCADTGIPTTTAIYIAPLSTNYNNAFSGIVRSNQYALASASWYTNAHIISVDGLFFGADGIHYNEAALQELGLRFSNKYLSQFPATSLPTAATNGTFFVIY